MNYCYFATFNRVVDTESSITKTLRKLAHAINRDFLVKLLYLYLYLYAINRDFLALKIEKF